MLHYEAFHNYPQAAKSLVKKGQNMMVFDSKARTSIDLAREKNHDKLIKFFEKRKIQIEECNEKLPTYTKQPPSYPKKLQKNLWLSD